VPDLHVFLAKIRYFCPSPDLLRKIRTALAFTVGGLVACASGVAILVNESVPLGASAIAPPVETTMRAAEAPTEKAGVPAVPSLPAQKIAAPEPAKSCARGAQGDAGARCDSGTAHKPGVAARSDSPAPAGVPVDRAAKPAVVVSKPPAAVSEPAAVAANPRPVREARESTDVAPAPSKPRKKVRHRTTRRDADKHRSRDVQPHRGGGHVVQSPWQIFFR
jgi:hypothetical protein